MEVNNVKRSVANDRLGPAILSALRLKFEKCMSAPEFNYKLTINPVLLNTRANDATILPVKMLRNVSEI